MRLRKPNGLHMSLDQVFIRQVQSRRCHCSRYHEPRPPEEVLVMGAAGRTVGEDQGRLATATCTPASLRIVGGGRRHISHVHNIQFGDVYT